MSRCWIPTFILASCLLIGCNREQGASHGNVAVVDLDKVAEQVGLSQHWSSELSAKQSNVNQQLAGYQQQLNEQLQQKRGEVVSANGEDTSLAEGEQMQLVSYQQELNGKLRRAQQEAKKLLSDERSRIIQTFRQEAKRVCDEVARQKGYDVVLTKNDSVVLTFDAAADITPDVSKLLQAKLAKNR